MMQCELHTRGTEEYHPTTITQHLDRRIQSQTPLIVYKRQKGLPLPPLSSMHGYEATSRVPKEGMHVLKNSCSLSPGVSMGKVCQYFCNFLERVKEFSCQTDECEIYLHFACVSCKPYLIECTTSESNFDFD